jgi:hypothetical protein
MTPEEAKERGIPVIPKLPPQQPYDPNPTVAVCGECGLEIKRIMGYCCQNERCPVQPRVTRSTFIPGSATTFNQCLNEYNAHVTKHLGSGITDLSAPGQLGSILSQKHADYLKAQVDSLDQEQVDYVEKIEGQ